MSLPLDTKARRLSGGSLSSGVGSTEDSSSGVFSGESSTMDTRAENETLRLVTKLVQECKHKIFEILKFSLSKVSNEPIFSQELITFLHDIAKMAESNRQKKNMGVIAGSSAGILSGCLTFAGIALFPVTFGFSTGVLLTGIAAGLTASGVNIAFNIDKWKNDKKRKEEVEEKLKDFVKFHKDLIEVVTVLFICKDLVDIFEEKICSHPDQIRRLEERDFSYHIGKMAQIHLATNIRHIFQFLDIIKQECENLKKTFEFLGENTNTAEVVKKMFQALEEKPGYTFECYSLGIQAFAGNNEKAFINFIKKYFELQTSEEGSPKTPLISPIDSVNVGARVYAVASSVGVGAVEATDELAKLGGVTFRVFNVFSAVSGVFGAIGLSFDVAFLGHAIYDIVKSGYAKEEFSQSLIDLANMMEKINRIEL